MSNPESDPEGDADAGTGTDVEPGSGPETNGEPGPGPELDPGSGAETDGGSGFGPQRGPYVESTIIMTTVRVVAPFVFTLGLFVMFHGADSPGGGFQGGAVVSAVLLMLAIAFGIEPMRDWLSGTVLKGVIATGVIVFVGIGLGPLLVGASFLEYSAYGIAHASAYGIELVELAIGAIVAGVLTGLFFAIAKGFDADSDHSGGDRL